MAAAILQVAVLAGAGVVEGAEAVGRAGRGGGGDPGLAEKRVAELELHLAFEGHVGGVLREDVGGGQDADCGGAGRFGLEGFGLGEVGGRGEDGGDLGGFLGRAGDHGEVAVVQRLAEGRGGGEDQDKGDTHGGLRLTG